MKKPVKKLSLSKETLHSLESVDLSIPVGGDLTKFCTRCTTMNICSTSFC